MNNTAFSRLALIATVLAFIVILLGAYTRLKDAGLGCPDWPGCYGQLTVPQSKAAIKKAEARFPGDAVQTSKAWLEMIHRYFAGSLGLFILVLSLWAIKRRFKDRYQPIYLPIFLVFLVTYQALLGKWTVTMKLLPIIVTAHLLGGMAILALLWSLMLATRNQGAPLHTNHLRYLRPYAMFGLLIVIGQIFLGAWTSSNYAALICPTFPFCHGHFIPSMNFHQAFTLLRPVGINYEGGVLDTTARVTIQMTHRYGAFITAAYWLGLSVYIIRATRTAAITHLGWFILAMLLLQVGLGIINVEWLLPMPAAVAHNGMAAMLLLAVVTLVYKLYQQPRSTVH